MSTFRRSLLLVFSIILILVCFFNQPHSQQQGIAWSERQQVPLQWYQETVTRMIPAITVGDTQYQRIRGFGAAMTDASAWVIFHSPQREKIMKDLFSPAIGLGISLVRLPIGASDFIYGEKPYSYDDLPPGQTDMSLTGFSIAHDEGYIIPLLKEAMVLNPHLKIIASPWSPPGWMKTNNSLLGSFQGTAGTLRNDDYVVYAQYLARFVRDYQQHGVSIYGLTIQNEPLSPVATYPGMVMSPTQEIRFALLLSNALQASRLRTKILLYDQNWNTPGYILALLKLVHTPSFGIAWHCYGGDPHLMTYVHEAFGMEQYISECSTGLTGVASMSAIQILISATQNWAEGIELWNLALDQTGGPKIGVGCTGCTGLVKAYPEGYAYTDNYYQLAQFSRFIKPGAVRIYSTDTVSGLETVTFQNPDLTRVLVVYNSSQSAVHFKVTHRRLSTFSLLMPQKTVTFSW